MKWLQLAPIKRLFGVRRRRCPHTRRGMRRQFTTPPRLYVSDSAPISAPSNNGPLVAPFYHSAAFPSPPPAAAGPHHGWGAEMSGATSYYPEMSAAVPTSRDEALPQGVKLPQRKINRELISIRLIDFRRAFRSRCDSTVGIPPRSSQRGGKRVGDHVDRRRRADVSRSRSRRARASLGRSQSAPQDELRQAQSFASLLLPEETSHENRQREVRL